MTSVPAPIDPRIDPRIDTPSGVRVNARVDPRVGTRAGAGDSRIRRHWYAPLFIALLACLATSAFASQPHPAVVEICLESKRPAPMCECAARRLAAEFPDQADAYAEVANRYLSNRRDGLRRRDAWSQAVEMVGTRGDRSSDTFADAIDRVSAAHQAAMLACGRS